MLKNWLIFQDSRFGKDALILLDISFIFAFAYWWAGFLACTVKVYEEGSLVQATPNLV